MGSIAMILCYKRISEAYFSHKTDFSSTVSKILYRILNDTHASTHEKHKRVVLNKQECIPVRCAPATCRLYMCWPSLGASRLGGYPPTMIHVASPGHIHHHPWTHPSQKGPEHTHPHQMGSGTRGTHPPPWTDSYLWKHYLPVISFVDGNIGLNSLNKVTEYYSLFYAQNICMWN